jgi:hypothetical protein
MSKVRTIFCGSSKSAHDSELELYAHCTGDIYISISQPDAGYPAHEFIFLDLDSAIKMSRVLRREISILKDGKA